MGLSRARLTSRVVVRRVLRFFECLGVTPVGALACSDDGQRSPYPRPAAAVPRSPPRGGKEGFERGGKGGERGDDAHRRVRAADHFVDNGDSGGGGGGRRLGHVRTPEAAAVAVLDDGGGRGGGRYAHNEVATAKKVSPRRLP